MREIKFRGWHSTQKKMISCEEMVNDQLTLLPDGRFINVNGASTKLSTIYPTDKFIPLQYTGLKDKNEVEIYEGDIVECTYNDKNSYNAIVEYDRVNPCFVLHQFGKDWYEYDFVGCGMMVLKIIGNIYENPELLKKEK